MDWIQQLQSANWHRVTGCALEAYVLGCFATGYYLIRARTGKDLRTIESGAIGARNAVLLSSPIPLPAGDYPKEMHFTLRMDSRAVLR